MTTVHASCVAIGGRGVMIAGPSGSGKSDLALRLIDRGALLVSDDYTVLARSGDTLVATAPPTIAGRIEVRGIGIVVLPALPSVTVALYIGAGTPERLPEPEHWNILDLAIPMLTLPLLEPSAPLKVEYMLRALA